MIDIPKNSPFKWLGGKKWLNDKITYHFNALLEKIPLQEKENITYIEPFCGGLGAFLAILPLCNKHNIKNIILNDINKGIIFTFEALKNDFDFLIIEYSIIEKEFERTYPLNVELYHPTKDKIILKKELKNAELFFKDRKKEFNILMKQTLNHHQKIKYAALFLFLSTHSFNGIYRENSKGEYNTPFNWDNKITNINSKIENFKKYHELFNKIDIIFENCDVFELLNKYKHNKSVLYLDPPYLNELEQENNYNKDAFSKEKQIALLEILKNYDYFLYSNHLMPLFEDYFSQNNHNYVIVERKNIITGKAENRGKMFQEILGMKQSTPH